MICADVGRRWFPHHPVPGRDGDALVEDERAPAARRTRPASTDSLRALTDCGPGTAGEHAPLTPAGRPSFCRSEAQLTGPTALETALTCPFAFVMVTIANT